MKSVLIIAALCAALSVAAPVSVQAAAPAKGPTDMQLFCTFFPLTAKCEAPAKATKVVKPVAKVTTVKHMTVAAAKPAAAKTGIKTMACTPAAKGKAYLYDCSWK